MSDLSSLKYKELYRECKERGLSTKGTKSQMLERLENDDNERQQNMDGDTPQPPPEEQQQEEEQVTNDVREETEEERDLPLDEPEDVDGDGDDNDDDIDDGEDIETSGSDEEHEILGMLVRRVRADDDDSPPREDEIMFIPTSDLEDSDEDSDMMYGDDEEIDSDAAFGDDDDDFDIDDDDVFIVQEKNSARLVVTSLLIFEALTFFYHLVLTPDGTVQTKATTPKEGIESPSENSVFFMYFITNLAEKWFTKVFWGCLIEYFLLCWLVPTVCGLALGEHNSVDSVFGFTVSRYAMFHLIKDFAFFKHFTKVLYPPLFTVTCGVGAIMAFWDRNTF